MDVIDLGKRANQRNKPNKPKTDFSKGTTRVYRDDSGKAAYTKEAIDASKDLNKKNVSYAKKQEKKDPATKGGSGYTVGAKGMLVSKPNTKKPTKGKTLVTKRS